MQNKLASPLVNAFALVGLALATPVPLANAAGTVGTGTGASCTESAFDTALGGGGAVTFNCGGPATITFTATKGITVATTISGGTGITLDGGGAVRLFNVTGGSLALDHITLANGHDTVGNPGAAAIDASANVTITDSTISGHHSTNGGCPAISMSGATLTITRSTVIGNVNAAAALGIPVCANNTAILNVTSSTITGNTGGGLWTSGTATVTNSTVAGNTSTGSGNSGGLVAFGNTAVMTLRNTIIANNVGTGQCAPAAGGTIVNGAGNLQFPDAACGAGIAVADPLLGALANNGGPTQTMALGVGSPAIDAAVPANCPATDQRGQAPADGDGNGSVICDIGAYEAPTFIPPPVVATPVPAISASLLAAMALLIAAFGSVLLARKRR
jgi:hypothetical protein